jgi:Asp/Glu/hydantoin racemase
VLGIAQAAMHATALTAGSFSPVSRRLRLRHSREAIVLGCAAMALAEALVRLDRVS